MQKVLEKNVYILHNGMSREEEYMQQYLLQ